VASPWISRLISPNDILAHEAGILDWIRHVVAQARAAPFLGPANSSSHTAFNPEPQRRYARQVTKNIVLRPTGCLIPTLSGLLGARCERLKWIR